MTWTATGASTTAPATTLAVPVPSGVALGDLILIYVNSQAASMTFSDTGDGFTAVTAASAQNCSAQLLYRTATSADVTLSSSSGSYTVTASVSHNITAICVDIPVAGGYGVFDPSTPSSSGQLIAAAANSYTGVTGPTTTSAGDLILLFACARSTSPDTVVISTSTGGYTAATGTGLTAGEILGPTGGTQIGTFLATFTQGSAGAVASPTIVWTSSGVVDGGGLIVAVTQSTGGTSPNAGLPVSTAVPGTPAASVGMHMTIQGV